jgi:hypothetical protein
VTEQPEQAEGTGPEQSGGNGSAPRRSAPGESFQAFGDRESGDDVWSTASREAGGGGSSATGGGAGGGGSSAAGGGAGGGGSSAAGGGAGQRSDSREAGRDAQSKADRQAGGRRQGGGSGQPGRRPEGRDSSRSRQAPGDRLFGGDLAAEVQRWLIRSGASSMRREFGEQVRRTLRGGRTETGDVWETATTEPPPDEQFQAPECAWCPICRAARRVRESGPSLGSQLAGAGDAVAAAVQEALSAFDAVLSANPASNSPKRTPGGSRNTDPRPAGGSNEGPDSEPDDRR